MTSSTYIVTYLKVAQSNQKRKGCQIILYFTLFKIWFRRNAPLKAERERKREREREESTFIKRKQLHWEKFLSSFIFLFTFFMLSLGSKCSSNPKFPKASGGLFLGAAQDPLGPRLSTDLSPIQGASWIHALFTLPHPIICVY
mgnify:CR=1 FL=1